MATTKIKITTRQLRLVCSPTRIRSVFHVDVPSLHRSHGFSQHRRQVRSLIRQPTVHQTLNSTLENRVPNFCLFIVILCIPSCKVRYTHSYLFYLSRDGRARPLTTPLPS